MENFDSELFLFEVARSLHAARDSEELDRVWREIVTPHAGKINERVLAIAMRLYGLNLSVLQMKGSNNGQS